MSTQNEKNILDEQDVNDYAQAFVASLQSHFSKCAQDVFDDRDIFLHDVVFSDDEKLCRAEIRTNLPASDCPSWDVKSTKTLWMEALGAAEKNIRECIERDKAPLKFLYFDESFPRCRDGGRLCAAEIRFAAKED